MTQNELKLKIATALDNAGLKATKDQVNGLAKDIRNINKESQQGGGLSKIFGSPSGLAKIVAGVGAVVGAIKAAQVVIGKFKEAISKAFEFQYIQHQFKFLIGSMDEAREHMEMLKELGSTPPFSLKEFADASKKMMVFTDGALGWRKSLIMVGDAAAAIGAPIEQVGEAVSRAYAVIRDGQPVARAATQLKNLGLITPATVKELDELQKSGASNLEIWQKVEQSLSKFSGAMKETEKTTKGAIGSLKSAWDDALRTFGESTSDVLTGPLNDLTKWIRDLEENGTLEVWGEKVANVMGAVAKSIGWVVDGLSAVYDHLKEGASSEPIQQQSDEKASWELLKEEKINPYKTKKTYRTAEGDIVEEYEVKEREERKWLRKKEEMEKQAAEDEKKRQQMEDAESEKRVKERREKVKNWWGNFKKELGEFVDKSEKAWVKGQKDKLDELEKEYEKGTKEYNRLKEEVERWDKHVKDLEGGLADLETERDANLKKGWSNWSKEEKDAAKQEEKDKKDKERNRKYAQNKLDRLLSRGGLFGEEGLSDKDKKKVAELRKFLVDKEIGDAKQNIEDAKERYRELATALQNQATSLNNIKIAIEQLTGNLGKLVI